MPISPRKQKVLDANADLIAALTADYQSKLDARDDALAEVERLNQDLVLVHRQIQRLSETTEAINDDPN